MLPVLPQHSWHRAPLFSSLPLFDRDGLLKLPPRASSDFAPHPCLLNLATYQHHPTHWMICHDHPPTRPYSPSLSRQSVLPSRLSSPNIATCPCLYRCQGPPHFAGTNTQPLTPHLIFWVLPIPRHPLRNRFVLQC